MLDLELQNKTLLQINCKTWRYILLMRSAHRAILRL